MKVKQTKLGDFSMMGSFLSGFGGMAFENELGRESRIIGNTETKFGVIDTSFASDTGLYETGVCDTRYRKDGEWIIVDEYKSKTGANKGHQKWIKILNGKDLPKSIIDVHTDVIYKLSK